MSVLIIPQPGSYDPIIDYLKHKKGLDIKNSLKLCRLANYWREDKSPEFLRSGSSLAPFLRLKIANITTYRKIGEADYFLTNIKSLINPLNFKLAPIIRDIQGIRDSFQAWAQLGAFFWCLTSALDSFAWEVVLIYGIEIHYRKIGFQRLLSYLKNHEEKTLQQETKQLLEKLSQYLIPTIEGNKNERDWYLLFNEYRHLFSHRGFPFLFHYAEKSIIFPHTMRINTFLQKDPFALLQYPSPPRGEKSEIESYIKNNFLEQPLIEYCEALFNKIRNLLDSCYEFLCNVYEMRQSGKVSYQTNYSKILPKPFIHNFKRFEP